ncbi:hypothetical protein N3K66_005208 [Trichothecium roseum]|uniref:Uncharacterized protein n=1 Tax=Trichothecium roseum TaxID=47278 RepID=A0ACC0V5A4_9HYPO|nr:hypothetical protein N3K66_005208 [Trichothecium roseum]
MPTLPIQFSPQNYDPIFTVTLENGKTYEGYIDLEVPAHIFRRGPYATVTFDTEEDLGGQHACTCALTETRSKVTAANGVVIDHGMYEESAEDETPMEINGTITWQG